MTPMVVGEWDRLLAAHPDQSYRKYLVDGLQYGFRIGFSHGVAKCRSAVSNMSSASERPSVIDEFIAAELAAGRIFGAHKPVWARPEGSWFGEVAVNCRPLFSSWM